VGASHAVAPAAALLAVAVEASAERPLGQFAHAALLAAALYLPAGQKKQSTLEPRR
jgi:hypothetical protein